MDEIAPSSTGHCQKFAGNDFLPMIDAGGMLAPCADPIVNLRPVSRRIEIETALRRLAPAIPRHEFGAVVDHALDSRGLKASAPETAAWLSVVAYVRHALTEYDDLLAQGYDQASARHFVAGDIQAVLAQWGVARRLATED